MRIYPYVSPSALGSWTDCRQQWYWSRPGGYKPRRRDSAFDLGIGVHIALADYYELGKDPVKVFTRWADQQIDGLTEAFEDDYKTLTEVRTLGIAMLEGYVEHYRNEKYEIVAVEREVVSAPVPGYPDWQIEARVDMIVRDPSRHNKPYVMEHKTFSRLEPDYLDLDHQFVAEAWLSARALKEPVEGVIYNGLRKQIPSSRTKLPMFERHYISVNDDQVRFFLRRVKEMIRSVTSGKLAIFPEPGPVKCNRCAYKKVCAALMRGEDYQYLLDTLFTRRDERSDEE